MSYTDQVCEIVVELPATPETTLVCTERLMAGEESYGPLDITTDQRSYAKEALEELYDAINYCAMAVLRARLHAASRDEQFFAARAADCARIAWEIEFHRQATR